MTPSYLIIFSTNQHGMSHAHGYMYPSSLPPCRINQVYYHPTPNAVLVGFLPDMGMFFHPKLPTTELQLLKLPPFQLRDGSNIDRLLQRPGEGSISLMHMIRRSEKLVALAGGIAVG